MNGQNQSQKLDERLKKLQNKYDLKLIPYTSPVYDQRQGQTPLGCVREYKFDWQDKKIAHVAFVPVELNFLGEKYKGLQASGVWVDPEFRGQGIFAALVHAAQPNMQENGYKFYYGFPNANAFPIWTKSLNCNLPCTAEYLVKPNNIENIFKKTHLKMPKIFIKGAQSLLKFYHRHYQKNFNKNYKVEKAAHVENISRDIERLFHNHHDDEIYFTKSWEIFKWQYQQEKYQFFLCYDNSELVGYFVTSADIKEGMKVAAILDFGVDRKIADKFPVIASLTQAFEKHYLSVDVYSVLVMSVLSDQKKRSKWIYSGRIATCSVLKLMSYSTI